MKYEKFWRRREKKKRSEKTGSNLCEPIKNLWMNSFSLLACRAPCSAWPLTQVVFPHHTWHVACAIAVGQLVPAWSLPSQSETSTTWIVPRSTFFPHCKTFFLFILPLLLPTQLLSASLPTSCLLPFFKWPSHQHTSPTWIVLWG